MSNPEKFWGVHWPSILKFAAEDKKLKDVKLYTKVHGFILVDERNIGPLAMPIQNV